MPTPTHDTPQPKVESPIARDMQGASGPPQENDGHDRPVDSGDQDIDTAGTAHDDESPTKSL